MFCLFCFGLFSLGSETAAGRKTAAGGNQPSEGAQAQAGKVRREGISTLGYRVGARQAPQLVFLVIGGYPALAVCDLQQFHADCLLKRNSLGRQGCTHLKRPTLLMATASVLNMGKIDVTYIL